MVLVQGTALLFAWDSSHRKEVSARVSDGHLASPRGWDSRTLADQPQREARTQTDSEVPPHSSPGQLLCGEFFAQNSAGKRGGPQRTREVDMKRQH